MIAAPTTSLPERIGGSRNYDYRYMWVRDTAFTIDALMRIGLPEQVYESWMQAYPRDGNAFGLAAGFASASQFARAVKAVTGRRPGELR